MKRMIQSSWFTALAGGVLYLGTTAALIRPSDFAGALFAESEETVHIDDSPSWRFRNPEFDQWLEELRREREGLALREQQLRDLENRIETERKEFSIVTQSVAKLQAEFDRNVVRIRQQEVENLKKQARVIASMSPDGAATMLNEMPDAEAVRILFTLKPDEASIILDNLSQKGKAEAKRASSLVEKMRHTLPPAPGER